MMMYFHAASRDAGFASSPTSTTLARVLPSISTNSRPRFPVSREASMDVAKIPKKAKYSLIWKLLSAARSSSARR